MTQEAAAVRLFESFQEREPREGEIVSIDASPARVLAVIGELEGVIYKALGDGESYIHRFKEGARPVLAVSHDGSQAYVLAGAYKFTDRGFVG